MTVTPILVALAMRVQADPIVLREFIYETAPFPSCHASTIAQTRSGLAAAWFGGTTSASA